MTSSDLLALAAKHTDPALNAALDRLREPISTDGPETAHSAPESLIQAMRYSLLSPGKRLRPGLVFGGAEAVGGRIDDVLPAACAVEMVHAYSLIHDDLPALDDDKERRGQPSCHIKFGEATALLAGDALLTEAFSVLADERPLGAGHPVDANRRIQAVHELGRAIGAAGMVGGQVDDLLAEAQPSTRALLETIHRRKTGRLIQAAVVLGGLFGGGSTAQLEVLRHFGAHLGLAFQLIDDCLDGDGAVLLDGPDAVRKEAARVTSEAQATLVPLETRAECLHQLAQKMAHRMA